MIGKTNLWQSKLRSFQELEPRQADLQQCLDQVHHQKDHHRLGVNGQALRRQLVKSKIRAPSQQKLNNQPHQRPTYQKRLQ